MTSRADLHCHSTASQLSRLGVQRALGLPECATPPQEVYELAKRRGMDFVTITDHDTIDGALELDGLPDTFVSEELTARFAGEPQAVHVLCLRDHSRRTTSGCRPHAGDVEACAAYLHEQRDRLRPRAPLLQRRGAAHPAPPPPAWRELFPIWEVRNGSRAAELNMPAAIYVETHGGTGIGGSDDHAGVDIGRTWTEVPAAATPEEFLAHMRAGHADAARRTGRRREVGARRDGAGDARARRPTASVRRCGSRPARRAEDGRAGDRARASAREGKVAADIGPEDARCLLEAWLAGVGHRRARGRELLDSCRPTASPTPTSTAAPDARHERRLRGAVDDGAGRARRAR